MKAARLIFCGLPTSGPVFLSFIRSCFLSLLSKQPKCNLLIAMWNLFLKEYVKRGVRRPLLVVSQGPAPWRLAEAATPWPLLETGVGPTCPGVGWVVCVTGWRLQGSGDTFGRRGVSHGDFCPDCTGYKEKLDVYQVFSHQLRLGQGWSCGKPEGRRGKSADAPIRLPPVSHQWLPGCTCPGS